MLFEADKLDTILELAPKDIPGFCWIHIDAEALSEHLDQRAPFASRKELCKYLGVGESTLTGWLKEDRIPRMAKEAFLLPLVIRLLGDEIRRLRAEARDLRILKNGDIYQICRFVPDGVTGEAIGEVVADNIADLQHARMILGGQRALTLLSEVDYAPMDFLIDHFSDDSNNDFLEYLEKIRRDIRINHKYAWDYDAWREERQEAVRAKEEEARREEDSLKKALKGLDEFCKSPGEYESAAPQKPASDQESSS